MPKKPASEYDWRELNMHNAIFANFDALFPDYYDATSKHRFRGGEIDIFAREKKSAKETWIPGYYTGGRPVIIELKQGGNLKKEDPTPQLLKYGSYYKDPILIGITEITLPYKRMVKGIQYFFYAGGELVEYHKLDDFAIYFHYRKHEPSGIWYHIRKKNLPPME